MKVNANMDITGKPQGVKTMAGAGRDRLDEAFQRLFWEQYAAAQKSNVPDKDKADSAPSGEKPKTSEAEAKDKPQPEAGEDETAPDEKWSLHTEISCDIVYVEAQAEIPVPVDPDSAPVTAVEPDVAVGEVQTESAPPSTAATDEAEEPAQQTGQPVGQEQPVAESAPVAQAPQPTAQAARQPVEDTAPTAPNSAQQAVGPQAPTQEAQANNARTVAEHTGDETKPAEGEAEVAKASGQRQPEAPAAKTDSAKERQAESFEDLIHRAQKELSALRAPAEQQTQAKKSEAPMNTQSKTGQNQKEKQEEPTRVAAAAPQPEITRAASSPVPDSEPGTRTLRMPDQAEQIETEIVRNLEDMKLEFRMQLQPKELGKIDVRMALEGGKLMVEIVSAAKTQELLSKQVDSLAASLRLNNPELTSVQVVAQSNQAGDTFLDNAFQNMNDSGSRQGRGEGGSHGTGGFEQAQDSADSPDTLVDDGRLLNYSV